MFRTVNDAMQKHLLPILPGNTATRYVPTTTDIGCLAVMSSNLGYLFASTGAADANLNLAHGIVGITAVVPEGCTHGSSEPFYVEPLFVGSVIEADFATTDYAGSSANEVVTTNIGAYFRTCYTTGSTTVGTEALNAIRTRYIDPSTRSNVPVSSACQIFKLMSFDSVGKTGVFRVQTS